MTHDHSMTFYFPNRAKVVKVVIDVYMADNHIMIIYDESVLMNPKTFSKAIKNGHMLEYCELVRLLYEV